MSKIEQKIEMINISELHLWTENPRDPVDLSMSDEDIIRRAQQDPDNKWNLKKLIGKMGEYYDYSELPTVVRENGKYVVYDGNRRVAILKCIQDKKNYETFIKIFFPDLEPVEMRSQTSIPCNVCNKETALNNVERKHIDNSSWGQIERDYFSHYHRKKEKSLFLLIDEQTKLISNNKILNQRFVKEEVLTEKNLKNIGIFLRNDTLKSNYTKEQVSDIFHKIIQLIESKVISTRNSRKELKRPLIENFKDLKEVVNSAAKAKNIFPIEQKTLEGLNDSTLKKTAVSKKQNMLFGKILVLEEGTVNDLYRAIEYIDKKTKDNENSLLVIGMSLRLILEVSARIYYKKIGNIVRAEKEQIYADFLKLSKREMLKENKNFVALTSDWLSDQFNLEGLLGKYAHGSIMATRTDVLKMSYIVADVLEFFFKKK